MSPNEVLWDTTAVRVHEAETELGSRVALFGCPFIPSGCLGEVLGRADPNIVGETELVLGVWLAPLCFDAQYVSAVLGIGYGGPHGFEMSPASFGVDFWRGGEGGV
jgi:hypothetical protein